jgi:hypothetical protein
LSIGWPGPDGQTDGEFLPVQGETQEPAWTLALSIQPRPAVSDSIAVRRFLAAS